MKVSVIIPVRNEEKMILKCLDSMENQNFPKDEYEVFIVDGKSTDRTKEIIGQYCDRNSNMFLLDNPNMIVPFALNIALRRVSGEIIIRVDGHCFVEDNFISKIINTFEKQQAECVGGVINTINTTFNGKAIALAMSSKFGVGNAAFRYSKKSIYVDTLAFGGYKKEVFESIGLFDEELVRCQDDEFNYRLRKNGGKIYLNPDIKVYYYSRQTIKKLIKQYYQYGFWKIRVFQKHPKMMQPRQFIPTLFILGLIFTGFLAIFINSLLFFIIMGSYIALSLFTSINLALRNGIKYLLLLPLLFLCLHLSYGIGFLIGLINFSCRWKFTFLL